MKLAPQSMREDFANDGLTIDSASGPVWTGALKFDDYIAKAPSRLQQPSAFYVCPHGDLFHELVMEAWLDTIFDEMVKNQRHWFQVLTKRARRQRNYITKKFGGLAPPNVAVGVSCERQKELDERVPLLLDTPAAVRYLILYPLLGPIKLERYLRTKQIASVLVGEEVERPAKFGWIESIQQECKLHGVEFVNSSALVGVN